MTVHECIPRYLPRGVTARQGRVGCLCLNPRHRLLQRLNSGMYARACAGDRLCGLCGLCSMRCGGVEGGMQRRSGAGGVVWWRGRGLRGLRGPGWCSGVSVFLPSLVFRWTCERIESVYMWCTHPGLLFPSRVHIRSLFEGGSSPLIAFTAYTNSPVSVLPLLGVVGSFDWTLRPRHSLSIQQTPGTRKPSHPASAPPS